MTFGKIKSIIESNLLESYKNEKDFKKSLREFKHNVLNDKSMSKAYSVYDQLSSPQGLSESDAKDYLEEGVNLLQRILPTIKLPKTLDENSANKCKKFLEKVINTIKCKKNIISILTSKQDSLRESINLPIKSMVNIANQTLRNYIETLDENTKKEFFQIISEDTKSLETKFESMRENTITKLQVILEKEEEIDLKSKISETIDRIKKEQFDQISFLKLKNLESSI